MHRATDGAGLWHSGNVFFGYHKLIISPWQQEETMPVEDEQYVITADARIDNRDHLAALIGLKKGDQPVPNDPLLILAAYKKWGETCADYLEGEFAFAIWDKQANSLFCAVDHIGFRPFYYYDGPDVFIFCSEMKGILAVKETPNVFNEVSLIEYFFRQSDPAKTYNDELFALLGGSTLSLKNNSNILISKYWSPKPAGKYYFTKDNDWADCLGELLFEAIENRLQTDMPVGVTLSGGLDSSSVACIAGRILEKRNKPLYAFSSVLPQGHSGVERDEREYINIIGRHVKNLEQTFVDAQKASPFKNLEQAFETEEAIPNGFWYMDHAINAASCEKNVRVLLSGFGGDYFVSYKGSYVLYRLIKQNKIGEALRLLRQSRQHEKSYLQILKTDFIAFTRFFEYYESVKNRNKKNWQSYTPLRDGFTKPYMPGLNFKPTSDQVDRMQHFIGTGQMSRIMGAFANRHAVYGQEAATPLFDKKVMEFMLDVPMQQYRVGGAKRSLLRRAMEGILPPEIQWRKDKLPYSPDYISRIIKEKQFILSLLQDDAYNDAWKYIDRARIKEHLDSLKPIEGMGSVKEVAAIRISQGVISACFIKWLKESGYAFK